MDAITALLVVLFASGIVLILAAAFPVAAFAPPTLPPRDPLWKWTSETTTTTTEPYDSGAMAGTEPPPAEGKA